MPVGFEHAAIAAAGNKINVDRTIKEWMFAEYNASIS